MKLMVLSVTLCLVGILMMFVGSAYGQVMPSVGGLCNTLEQSRSIMSLPNGLPALVKFRQLTAQGECFLGIKIPVASVCLVNRSTFRARPGRVFNTYRFTDPGGTHRYGATAVPSRLNNMSAAVSAGTCGGDEA